MMTLAMIKVKINGIMNIKSVTHHGLKVKWVRSDSSSTPVRSMTIHRLNSGIRNRHNFFLRPIYIFQKVLSDSVNHADSGDIKVFVRFPGNTILKIFTNFWKCVGGADIRGCFILKITQCVDLITLVILIYKISGNYLILP